MSIDGNDSNIDGNTLERNSPNDPASRSMTDRQAREAYELTARSQLPAEFARQFIDAGGEYKNFRQALFDRLAADADRTATNPVRSGNDATFSNPEFLSRSIEDALYSKMTGQTPKGAAVELVGRSMLDMGAMLLEARGERVSWASRTNLASQMMQRSLGGMHTTSDFPILLTSAGQRVM